MQYKQLQLQSFHVVGISVRTINQDNRSQRDIATLWQRFYKEQLPGKITGKLSEELYCIYTDYESDDKGWYTTLLGYKVASIDAVPAGCTGITVPSAGYFLFESTGKVPDCVMASWHFIWSGNLNRKYAADFDVYPAVMDPQQATVFTYLSVQ